MTFNLLKTELNPICHLLALLDAHPILHFSRIGLICVSEQCRQLIPFYVVKCICVSIQSREKPKYSEKNLFRRCFVHHKSHTDWLGFPCGHRCKKPVTDRIWHYQGCITLLNDYLQIFVKFVKT